MTRLVKNIIIGFSSLASVHPQEQRIRIVVPARVNSRDAISGDFAKIGGDFRSAVRSMKSVKVVPNGSK